MHMSMVVPFKDCIARPSEKDKNKINLLSNHLMNVANGWSNGKSDHHGSLFFLGGLCHDAGKAQREWQIYINNKDRKHGEGPDHSPIGSFLFAYLAHLYLRINGLKERLFFNIIVSIIRDIYDHHGDLKDIDSDKLPWHGRINSNQLLSMDLEGFKNFITDKMSVFKNDIVFEAQALLNWEKEYRDKWQRLTKIQRPITAHEKFKAADKCLRIDTASFIISDRIDASGIEYTEASVDEFKLAREKLLMSCTARATKHTKMNEMRSKVQEEVLNNYYQNTEKNIFTLSLPTGYGKTIASLKVALEACCTGEIKRIVYVAPYLSILSQATDEIAELTGLEVLQHHHLSIEEDLDERKLLTLETWKAPVITTTFNQLFLALFPHKAQHAMRLDSLKNSFIIIDEPQIISIEVWNIFLLMINSMTEKINAKALFVTATMPPVKYCLRSLPQKLEPFIDWFSRYEVIIRNEVIWDENDVADQVADELQSADHIGVVVNTVKDCALVYKKLKEKLSGEKVILISLHGLMLGAHKNKVIKLVKWLINRKRKLVLISTQIIEAGVDISFQVIFRALPIIPSAVQTAGRINRNNDGILGKLIVFRFKREKKIDTRRYVYKDEYMRKVTDKWFNTAKIQLEEKFYQEAEKYFEKVFSHNTHFAYVDKIIKAANGKWKEVTNIQPFGDDYLKIAVFVPWKKMIDKKVKKLMAEFSINNLDELYNDFYKDKEWMGQLTFLERKKFMALMQKFIVNVDVKLFKKLSVINKSQKEAIYLLSEMTKYDKNMGLAYILLETDEELGLGEFL